MVRLLLCDILQLSHVKKSIVAPLKFWPYLPGSKPHSRPRDGDFIKGCLEGPLENLDHQKHVSLESWKLRGENWKAYSGKQVVNCKTWKNGKKGDRTKQGCQDLSRKRSMWVSENLWNQEGIRRLQIVHSVVPWVEERFLLDLLGATPWRSPCFSIPRGRRRSPCFSTPRERRGRSSGSSAPRRRRSPLFSSPRRRGRSPRFSIPVRRRTCPLPGFSLIFRRRSAGWSTLQISRRNPGSSALRRKRRRRGFWTLLLFLKDFFWHGNFCQAWSRQLWYLHWSQLRWFSRWVNLTCRRVMRRIFCRAFCWKPITAAGRPPGSISRPHRFPKTAAADDELVVRKHINSTQFWPAVVFRSIEWNCRSTSNCTWLDHSVFHIPTSKSNLTTM